MDLTKQWVNYLRTTTPRRRDSTTPKLQCPAPSCGKELENDEDFRRHVEENPGAHPGWDNKEALDEVLAAAQAQAQAQATAVQSADTPGAAAQRPAPANQASARKRRTPDEDDERSGSPTSGAMSGHDDDEDSAREVKRAKTPPTQTSQSSPQRRGTRNANPSGRTLWEDNGPKPHHHHHHTHHSRAIQPQHTHSPRQLNPSKSVSSASSQPTNIAPVGLGQEPTAMLKQPETRPISQDQLVAEVKGIYAGLVMVETKCIEVDNAQSSNKETNSKLNNEQWQALIALHRTLLHEHHDFFLASQHPSASAPLRRLASKYAMPARMWRHGIHSFLELLRRKLPSSLEHMLTFLYLAYSMMALLYETVPAFEDTWIECLGDLGRYRMAIEDDDIRDREVWTGVSRHWYSKASDKSPTTGRLYHHLAILARPNALQQLFFYAKSLCVPVPFPSARESVMTLFDPLLTSSTTRLPPIDAAFVRAHGILFSGKCPEKLEESMDEFLSLLDNHIGRMTKRWLEAGYFIGISTGCSLLGYGSESNVLMRAMAPKPDDADGDAPMEGSPISPVVPVARPVADAKFLQSLEFAIKIVKIVINRWGDTNTLAFTHTFILFLSHLAKYPAAMSYIEAEYPWKLTSELLNQLRASCDPQPELGPDFARAEEGDQPRPLPEDYAMRGLTYAADYFPEDWFNGSRLDEDEKYFELPSMTAERKLRILSLGYRLASHGKWLTFDASTQTFGVVAEYNVEFDEP